MVNRRCQVNAFLALIFSIKFAVRIVQTRARTVATLSVANTPDRVTRLYSCVCLAAAASFVAFLSVHFSNAMCLVCLRLALNACDKLKQLISFYSVWPLHTACDSYYQCCCAPNDGSRLSHARSIPHISTQSATVTTLFADCMQSHASR